MLWIKVLLVFVLILNVYVNGLPWREEPQVLPSDPITSDKDTPPSVNFEARGHSIHESSTETPPETVHPMDTTETTGDTFPTRGPHKWRPRTTKEHQKPGKSSQGGKDPDEDSSKILYYLIGFAILLLIVIAIVWTTIWVQNMKKSKKSSSSSTQLPTDEPVTEGPLDPRYGKLDPNLNLSLRIAYPSVANLDQQIEDQSSSSKPMPSPPNKGSKTKRSKYNDS